MLTAGRPVGRIAVAVALFALGCRAQTPAPAVVQAGTQSPSAAVVQVGVKLSPDMARRAEVMIRSKSSISVEYAISFGVPTISEVPGYYQVNADFTAPGGTPKGATFLLSADGKTLAQFLKLDLSQDPRDKVSPAGRPARGGGPNAPVLIVGFDDLECPFCARLNAELFPAILDRYKDQVRVVYRDFPLEQHPWAMRAAVDANCLGEVSAEGYWNFVDYVHAHAADLPYDEKVIAKTNETLDKLTLDEGTRQKVNQADLAACIQKQDASKVKAAVLQAENDPLSVDSTPVLFINGEKVVGVVPVETIYRVIDDALIAAGQTPPPAPPKPAPAAQPAAKPGS